MVSGSRVQERGRRKQGKWVTSASAGVRVRANVDSLYGVHGAQA